MQLVKLPQRIVDCQNFVGGRWSQPSSKENSIVSPYTGSAIGRVWESTRADVDAVVAAAKAAQRDWAETSLKDRTQVMFKFREILLRELEDISHTISAESGKLLGESQAGLLKGIEVLEFALSIQNLDAGGKMEVSSGVTCETRREPLGVVAGITPFNFPAMVPMWMIPIAITLGNSFVWKPSDKTPLTSLLIADALDRAGLPKGVLSLVQGGREAAEALCEHKDIEAVGFVGSTNAARAVYVRGTSHGKRVLALGGAKNHLILMPDADPEIAAQGIVSSYTGCAGQRCMAASALLAVGDVEPILQKVAERSQAMQLGKDMGAIISKESLMRLERAIDDAKAHGAKLVIDGRTAKKPAGFDNGFWLGPTLLDNVDAKSPAGCEELFGPVLSVIRCRNLSQALQIENENPYGNAAAVFTTLGAVAEEVSRKARAGMVGVNIGVPVPREPFSFGGFYASKFGQGDITGHGGIDFWTRQKKVTMKWTLPRVTNWMS